MSRRTVNSPPSGRERAPSPSRIDPVPRLFPRRTVTRLLSHNRGSRFPNSKQCRVGVLNANPYGKTCGNVHPVQSVLHVGKAVAEPRIVGGHAKTEAFHDSIKTPQWLAHHIDRKSTRLNSSHLVI